MPYDNTPRVTATFNEVGLITPVVSSKPEVLVLGPASGGRSYEKYWVGSIGQAEKEFGRTSPGIRVVHEAFAEGADNISMMRIGGRPGSVVITVGSETLTLRPWDRGDDVLDRYVPIIIAAEERLIVYDYIDEFFVYDSEDILVIDDGIIEVDPSAGWTHTVDLNASVDLTNIAAEVAAGTAKHLGQLVVGDFTPNATAVDTQQGSDGLAPSLVERYAALATGYHLLNFRDADIVVPADAYIDDANIANISSPSPYGYYWWGRADSTVDDGVPVAGAANDVLGYVAHYIYQGQLYTLFADTQDYFSTIGSRAAASSGPHFTDLQLDVQTDYDGKGGNACTFEYVVGAAGPSVTVTANADGGVDIVVTDDGTAEDDAVAAAINLELANVVTGGGDTYDNVIVASGSAGTPIGAVAIAKANFSGGVGGHFLTPNQLTGDEIPAALDTILQNEATDTWLRECSFDHQLATFCQLAGNQWSTMHGTIGVKRPPSTSRAQLATWVGSLPTYSTDSIDKWIESDDDDGDGLLGLKLYAGKSQYRGHIADGGGSNNGIAYGGLIQTKGTGLPTVGGNFGSGFPYGINDGDEALDDNGFPVDIGKWIIPTFDWPPVSNGYSGGSVYRTNFAGPLAGLIARLPVNKLPIGQFGVPRSTRAPLKIHPTQLDALAVTRLTGTKPDEDFGTTLISGNTAAHPGSDYRMISTSRSIAALVSGIRAICKQFLGRPYTGSVLASLQQEVDQYVATAGADEENALHDGALAVLTFDRRKKVLGQVDINLRAVPPFGIQEINIFTSLAADESEL